MIQGFSTIVQEDLVLLIDHVRGKGAQDDEQNRKVGYAALRMLAVLGMAFSAIITLSALSAFFTASVTSTLFQLSFAAALYAFNHDVFVMAKNATEQMGLVPAVVDGVIALLDDFIDLFKGKKDETDAPCHPVTEGTFFRPIWDKTFTEIAQRR